MVGSEILESAGVRSETLELLSIGPTNTAVLYFGISMGYCTEGLNIERHVVFV